MQKGHARQVIDELAELRGQDASASPGRHLRRFQVAVAFDSYREPGLRAGSGEVESAHRSVPQKRLKLPGASWSPATVNPLLALPLFRANRWWAGFWAAAA